MEKEIDTLGRIVIPIHIRKKLNLQTDNKVNISESNGQIILTPNTLLCKICNRPLVSTKEKVCPICKTELLYT